MRRLPPPVLVSAMASFAIILFGGIARANASDALADAYLEWRGGDAFTSATSLVQEGEAELLGMSGTVQVIQMRDGHARTEITLPAVSALEVVTPDGGWSVNPNGQVEDMGASTLRDQRHALALAFAEPLTEDAANVTRLPDELHAGATWGVLHVAWEGGDYTDLLIDPATGALEWMRTQQDTDLYWTHLTDWQVTDGVRMPGRTELIFEDALLNQTFTWETSYVNAPIPSIAFERMDTADRITFAGGATTTDWIPFYNFRNQRIFVPATINGVSTEVILDSGAEMTVVDAALAEEAGLMLMGAVQAQGTAGTQEVQFATGATLVIGGLEFHDLTVAVIDLSPLSPRLGHPLQIILGKEVFNETIVDIDYPNSRIAFHDPDAWTYEGNGAVVPLLEFDDSRVVEISIEGRDPILAGFDIGQGDALTIYETYADAERLLDGRAASTVTSAGIGGVAMNHAITVETLTFGGFTFTHVPADVPVDNEGSFATSRHQANLGTDVFNRFRMIVNYSADEIFLEPAADALTRPFDRNNGGIQSRREGNALVVSFVMAGSPAEAAGIAEGDEITAINGHPIDEGFYDSVIGHWQAAPAGTEAELTLADGRTITLTLTEFY